MQNRRNIEIKTLTIRNLLLERHLKAFNNKTSIWFLTTKAATHECKIRCKVLWHCPTLNDARSASFADQITERRVVGRNLIEAN